VVESDAREQRLHRRLEVKLPLEYCRVDALNSAAPCRCVTQNVSTGGLYFETACDDLRVGDQLQLHLSVPPGDSRFPPHAKVTTVGRIVRTMCIKEFREETQPAFTRYGIAAQFQSPLKFLL